MVPMLKLNEQTRKKIKIKIKKLDRQAQETGNNERSISQQVTELDG